MKIKIIFDDIGISATVTYLETDGKLEFNPDQKSGIIHRPSGIYKFEVVD